MARVLLILFAAATLTGSATAARLPDPHDRALMQELEAKVVAYQGIGQASGDVTDLSKHCAFLKKRPSLALSASFALLPAAVIKLVQRYHGPIMDMKQTLARMQPHDDVFRRWVKIEQGEIGFLLRFDNGGKKIDSCGAAQLLLSKHPDSGRIKAVLGVSPLLIAQLFQRGFGGENKTLKRLNPQMRTFLIAGGVTPVHAATLTS